MDKIIRLKKNTEFRRLYKRGKSAVAPTLVMYALKNRLGYSRLGLTAGKKVGCAVRRNRAKRRLRALYQVHVLTLPENRRGFDLVIVARAAAVNAPHKKLERDFVSCTRKILESL